MGTTNNQTERLHTLRAEVASKKGCKTLTKDKCQNINRMLSNANTKKFNGISAILLDPVEVQELLKLRPGETLSARGYACVGLFYGLSAAECPDEISQKYCQFDGKFHSLKEIGKIIHVTPERVFEIIVKTLRKCCNENKWVNSTETQSEPVETTTETTATDNVKSSIAVAMVPGIQL